MSSNTLLLSATLMSGYGTQGQSWRAPENATDAYTDMDAQVKLAQTAERGKFAFLFAPDFPGARQDMEFQAPSSTLDPIVTLSVLAHQTSRIGFVATGSTTYNEPYNLARQFKALDVLSRGRIGWNAVTTSDPIAVANYGEQVRARPERYARAHEMIQIVQALWGSWGEDAWIRDVGTGRFVDMDKVQPINLSGQHVASRGPLVIPPSEQGQPVIASAGGGEYGLGLAGRYASVAVGSSTYDFATTRQEREIYRSAAGQAGRDPDELKYFTGFMPVMGATVEEAIGRRMQMDEHLSPQRVPMLGMMLGLSLDASRADQPLTAKQLEALRPNPGDPRSARAVEIARQGWTPREILGHGVIDYAPSPVGPPEAIADYLQEAFEAGIADGFWLQQATYAVAGEFVDQVVPILQRRGLYHRDYEGSTLREHLGVPRQYGQDPRIS